MPCGVLPEHCSGRVELTGKEVAKLVYIDNFASLSVNGDEAEDAMWLMLGHLAALGVAAGPEDDDVPLLGIDLVDGLVWKPTSAKFWRVSYSVGA